MRADAFQRESAAPPHPQLQPAQGRRYLGAGWLLHDVAIADLLEYLTGSRRGAGSAANVPRAPAALPKSVLSELRHMSVYLVVLLAARLVGGMHGALRAAVLRAGRQVCIGGGAAAGPQRRRGAGAHNLAAGAGCGTVLC